MIEGGILDGIKFFGLLLVVSFSCFIIGVYLADILLKIKSRAE